MFQLLLLVAALQRPASPTDEFRSIHAFQCEYGGGAGHIFEPIAPEEEAEERVLTSPPLMYNEVRGLTFDSIDYRSLRAWSVTKDRPEAVTVTVIPGDRLVSFSKSVRRAFRLSPAFCAPHVRSIPSIRVLLLRTFPFARTSSCYLSVAIPHIRLTDFARQYRSRLDLPTAERRPRRAVGRVGLSLPAHVALR